MSINILDQANSYFTSAIVGKLSGIVGENALDVQKALVVVLPSLLGGIMQKASTTSGANEILGLVTENKNETLLNDLLQFPVIQFSLIIFFLLGLKFCLFFLVTD